MFTIVLVETSYQSWNLLQSVAIHSTDWLAGELVLLHYIIEMNLSQWFIVLLGIKTKVGFKRGLNSPVIDQLCYETNETIHVPGILHKCIEKKTLLLNSHVYILRSDVLFCFDGYNESTTPFVRCLFRCFHIWQNVT